jgi:SAM-dependent methyltransferase
VFEVDRPAAWQDAVVVTVDPRAATGFASAVDAYERGRPSYPPAAVANLAREFGLTPASTVLDLAAGTGKLTRVLVPLAGHVIGVEPSEPMRAELRAQVPTVDARAGTAEAIPAADGSVDAVFVGQAFHWFRTAEACREIARVLAPGGGLALLWNRAHWSEPELPLLTALGELLEPYRKAAGPFPAGDDQWQPVLEATGAFAPLSSAEVEHVHVSSPDDVVALVASWSWIANLPDDERAEVLRRVGELAGDQRRLTLRYRTEIHWTRLI